MDTSDDVALRRVLQHYRVDDADDALLERVMEALPEQSRPATTARRPAPWLAQASALAACAAFGFWLGQATLPPPMATPAPLTQDYDLSPMILGVHSIEEVML